MALKLLAVPFNDGGMEAREISRLGDAIIEITCLIVSCANR